MMDYRDYSYYNLGTVSAIKEYLERSGAYVGPPDPYAPDDFSNLEYYLPKLSDETKMELTQAIKYVMVAHVYTTRFHKLRSGEDTEEEFVELLRKQLDEVKFPKCQSCGIRDYPEEFATCRYCGSIMG
jgi:hypothetical protein